MTITAEDLARINTSVNVPVDPAADKAAADAQDTPQTAAAKDVLRNVGVPSRALVPQQNDFQKVDPSLTDKPEDAGYASRFKSSFGDLLGLKSAQQGGLMPLLALSGLKAMPGSGMGEDDSAPTGNVSFDQATSNADQTKPTTLPAQPNPRVLGAQNALQSFAAGAAAEGSPFNAISKNLEAQQQQRKDALTNAKLMADTLHEQQVIHALGEEQVANAVKTGQGGLQMMLDAHHPGELRASNKTSDEIKNLIATGKIDTKQDTVWLTGRVQQGSDKNGQPIFRSTYSVARAGGPITFDGTTNEDERNFINDKLGLKPGDPRYIAGPDEKNGKPGQTLPAVQVNQLYKQAQVADANESAAEESVSRNQLERNKAQIGPDTQKLLQSNELAKALGDTATKGDPSDPDHVAKAYYALKGNPDAMKSLGLSADRLEAAFREYASPGDPKHFDTMLENYQKTREKMQEKLASQMTDTMAIEHPEGTAAAAQKNIQMYATQAATQQAIVDAAAKNPNDKTAQDNAAAAKVEISRIKALQDNAQRLQDISLGTLRNKADQKRTEAEQAETGRQNAASNQDFPNDLEAALRYDVDPKDLFGKNRSSAAAAFMEKVQATAKERGMNWSEAEYKKRYDTVRAFGSNGKEGAAIRSLDTFVGHAAGADNNIGQLFNTKSEWLNQPINKYFTSVEGKSNAVKMRTDLAIAADEWMKFVTGAPGGLTDKDKELAKSIVNENSSPQVIHDALVEMAKTVEVRSKALNNSYRRDMDTDYPKMYSPESANLLQNQFNINVRNGQSGGIMGESTDSKHAGNQNAANPPAPPSGPNTHQFDAAAWAKANPGRDVKKAMATAKLRGYEIVNEVK